MRPKGLCPIERTTAVAWSHARLRFASSRPVWCSRRLWPRRAVVLGYDSAWVHRKAPVSPPRVQQVRSHRRTRAVRRHPARSRRRQRRRKESRRQEETPGEALHRRRLSHRHSIRQLHRLPRRRRTAWRRRRCGLRKCWVRRRGRCGCRVRGRCTLGSSGRWSRRSRLGERELCMCSFVCFALLYGAVVLVVVGDWDVDSNRFRGRRHFTPVSTDGNFPYRARGSSRE